MVTTPLDERIQRMTRYTWRAEMHPDDRAWLYEVELPLFELGYQPPISTTMPDPGIRERRRGPVRGQRVVDPRPLEAQELPPPPPPPFRNPGICPDSAP